MVKPNQTKPNKMKKTFIAAIMTTVALSAFAQGPWQGKFEQLGTTLASPNTYRTASGAPGRDYWQQKADYTMEVVLDDEKQTITGSETITYYNQSPDDLRYLWLQVDQNMRAQDSDTKLVLPSSIRNNTISTSSFQRNIGNDGGFNGGFKIKKVVDQNGKPMKYFINKTMLRIDLPEVLEPGKNISFSIDWWYNINDRMKMGGRSGYEYFPKDDNYLYTIAQWFPRMCVYDDKEGWQNKQFLGRGEFALVFGDYKVKITVPSDHIVASTGWLQNPEEVLTETQQSRFKKAQSSEDEIVMIVTEAEAKKKERKKASDQKTWVFHAENVRDFAFASSRKFIWDAQAVDINGKKPLAMSYYPKEGNPLWELESTKAVANTLRTYSKMTIDYPYPVAISVHTASIGMEYPMICFNFGRPKEDGTYSDAVKWRMIGVIIHEVGHNFFPMIINSDERQWTWMDEGLNSFVQYVCQVDYYPTKPLGRGAPANITGYMKGDPSMIRPIMTNSEQIIQFGNNAYGKPATALNILRETVMGKEMFDHAFKEYATRWAFKHPDPADFFRTMEDASGMDLDWFWKGWFYTIDYVDIELTNVKWYKVKNTKAGIENKTQEGKIVNNGQDANGNNTDFSGGYEEVALEDTYYYGEFTNSLDDNAIRAANENKNLYEITFTNKGGLVMPIIVEWTYKDGTKELEQIPAEIWRANEEVVTKVFAKDKEVVNIIIDPNLESADVDVMNNTFPKNAAKSKFEQAKKRQR